jgi:hypothetical protein
MSASLERASPALAVGAGDALLVVVWHVGDPWVFVPVRRAKLLR